jgi:type 1 fimbriae regulatory protein FimB/type 1 fimbriae regulatory protein FimE
VRQPRGYLTPGEVERLMKAALGRGGRHGHRDAALLLLDYRHG